MSTHRLGSLTPISVRRMWPNEGHDFTPWLAAPVNLQLLGHALGLDLADAKREVSVDQLSADILCRNRDDGARVLIENQFGWADADHLGRLLMYAAGLDATTIVWVAEQFSRTHREALNWLNQTSADGIRFFGVTIECWQIGQSDVAPQFTVVAYPKDWRPMARNDQQRETSRQYLEFWTAFHAYMQSNSRVNCSEPKQHWMIHEFGGSATVFASNLAHPLSRYNDDEAFRGGPKVFVALNLYDLHGNTANQRRSKLAADKDDIHQELGAELIWTNVAWKGLSRVYTEKFIDWRDPSQRETAMAWMREQLEKFTEVLKPRVLALTSQEAQELPEELDS